MQKNERYAVTKPLYEACPGVKNRQSPTMTYMSDKQVPGVNYYLQLGWINGIPDPNPHAYEHTHDYDEVILYWGNDYNTPQVLGGEIEFYIGGQPITFNTNAGIYIPKGVRHGPVIWNKFKSPHVQMNLMLGTGSFQQAWGNSSIAQPRKRLPQKTDNIDYEQYVIRSPMREAAVGFTGFQSPSMTYMSSVQINKANLYIDYAWVVENPKPQIGEHVHYNNDEIVLHIGGDPNNPEDLGADLDYPLGGEPMQFSTSFAAFLPKGLPHGPLNFRKIRKPVIEIAIVFGVGTFKARSEGSALLSKGKYDK